MLHSISGRFKVGLGSLVNAYSSHFVHMGKRMKPTKSRGSLMGTKEVDFEQQGGLFPGCKGTVLATTKPGGIMEVPMLGFNLAWV